MIKTILVAISQLEIFSGSYNTFSESQITPGNGTRFQEYYSRFILCYFHSTSHYPTERRTILIIPMTHEFNQRRLFFAHFYEKKTEWNIFMNFILPKLLCCSVGHHERTSQSNNTTWTWLEKSSSMIRANINQCVVSSKKKICKSALFAHVKDLRVFYMVLDKQVHKIMNVWNRIMRNFMVLI